MREGFTRGSPVKGRETRSCRGEAARGASQTQPRVWSVPAERQRMGVTWDTSHLPPGTRETGREQQRCRGSGERGAEEAAGAQGCRWFSAAEICSSLEREPEPRSHPPSAQVPGHRLRGPTDTLQTKRQDATLHQQQSPGTLRRCGSTRTSELLPDALAGSDAPAGTGWDVECSLPPSEPQCSPRAPGGSQDRPQAPVLCRTMRGGG